MKIVSNGIAMTINSGGGGSSQDIYSVEEQVVGTWIDSSPVYRIVISGTSGPQLLATKLIYPLQESPRYLKVSGILTESGGSVLPVPYSAYSDSRNIYTIAVYYDSVLGGVCMWVSYTTFLNSPFTIVLDYVKGNSSQKVTFSESDLIMTPITSVYLDTDNTIL